MVDKVRPQKLESAATGGTQEDTFPTAVNPAQDYISAKGITLEDDDNTRLEKDSEGDIVAISAPAGTVKLRSPIPLIIALG